jgi:hypothetical protein
MDYWCDGDATCSGTPINIGGACDDGNPLTTGDVCLSSGICQGTSACSYPSWSFDAGFESWIGDISNWRWCDTTAACYGDPWTDGNMQFYWYDELYNYDYSLTSSIFNISACSSATLGFEFEFDWYSDSYYNYFYAECYTGSTWYTLYSYASTSGQLNATTITATLPSSCRISNARLRFRATGDDTMGIWGWNINLTHLY